MYNGKGNIKEYYKGKLSYKGEYLNGNKNGKGIEYYYDGQLKYIGEYLNGKRNGKGKEFHENSLVIFEGEFLDGKRWKREGKDCDFLGVLFSKESI